MGGLRAYTAEERQRRAKAEIEQHRLVGLYRGALEQICERIERADYEMAPYALRELEETARQALSDPSPTKDQE